MVLKVGHTCIVETFGEQMNETYNSFIVPHRTSLCDAKMIRIDDFG